MLKQYIDFIDFRDNAHKYLPQHTGNEISAAVEYVKQYNRNLEIHNGELIFIDYDDLDETDFDQIDLARPVMESLFELFDGKYVAIHYWW